MDLDRLIRRRKSIRQMKSERMPKKDIKKILEAARFSPSWTNNQPWRFIVVEDRGIIAEIDSRITAPTVIIACAKKGESGYLEGQRKTKFNEWFMFDMGIAVYGLCLKAFELGYGSVIKGNINHSKVSQLLSLPKGFEVVVAIPVGIAKERGRKKERKKFQEIVFRDQFGKVFK